MKRITAAALVAAQLASAAPASGAELLASGDPAQTRLGAFAGGRLRVELGGRNDGRPRLGLAVAPYSHRQAPDGRVTLRYGEGFEFGIVGREPARVRLAGYRLAPGGVPVDPNGRRLGLSTLETAGVVAGVIVVGALVFALTFRADED